MTDLVRVVAPHFVAGLVVSADRVTHAAPILRWAAGKSRSELRAYFVGKGWQASIIGKASDGAEREDGA